MYVCMRFSLGTFEQTNNLIIRQCSMRSRTHKHTYQHSIYAKRAKSIDSHWNAKNRFVCSARAAVGVACKECDRAPLTWKSCQFAALPKHMMLERFLCVTKWKRNEKKKKTNLVTIKFAVVMLIVVVSVYSNHGRDEHYYVDDKDKRNKFALVNPRKACTHFCAASNFIWHACRRWS